MIPHDDPLGNPSNPNSAGTPGDAGPQNRQHRGLSFFELRDDIEQLLAGLYRKTRIRVGDETILLDLSDLGGPLLEPLHPRLVADLAGDVSTFVLREKVQDQRGRAVAERLIGRRPTYRPCPRAVPKLLEGTHPSTEGTDLVVLVRCRCWTCYVCRDRRRWVEKRKHIPFALEHGTHVFRGSADEWAAYRKRLARSKQVAGTLRIVSADGVVVILSAHTTDDLPEHPGLARVDGEGAAQALAWAVDSVPDSLRPEPGKQKVKPFTTNAHWLVSEGADDDVDPPVDRPGTAAVDAPVVDDPEPAEAEPLSYYRAVPGRLVVSVDRAQEIIAGYGLGARRGHLVDAPLVGDGSVEDSLAWSAPIGDREQIRQKLFGTYCEYEMPASFWEALEGVPA